MKYRCTKSFTAVSNRTSYEVGVKISRAEYAELTEKEKQNFLQTESLSASVKEYLKQD